jgi:polyisoprenoid-binding protein YceI
MKKRLFASIAVGLALFMTLSGQTSHKYKIDKNKIIIKGTSNLHDWKMEVEDINGNMDADIKDNKIESINSLTLNVNVNSIKSGKSLMDKKTYYALKSELYPEIHFSLSGISDIIINNKGQLVTANGVLSIAGIKKSIQIKAIGSTYNNGDLGFTGSKSLKMSDFNIMPPTAIFGTLKTGDSIVVEFDISFKNMTK